MRKLATTTVLVLALSQQFLNRLAWQQKYMTSEHKKAICMLRPHGKEMYDHSLVKTEPSMGEEFWASRQTTLLLKLMKFNLPGLGNPAL